jgi:hypothetical protein
MSADNGIYILRTKRTRKLVGNASVKTDPYYVYRVAHAQAIDNFEYYNRNQPYNLGAYMISIWGSSVVHETSEAALLDAKNKLNKIHHEEGICEYGIVPIDTDLIFFGDC